MNCRECEARLVEHLYGDETNAAELRDHLVSCDRCEAKRRELAQTVRMLDAWTPVESPCDARLVAGIAAAQPPARRVSRIRRAAPWLGGLAAGAILYAGLSLLTSRAHPNAASLAESDVAELVRAEITRSRRMTLDAVEHYFADWDAEQTARLVAMAEAFDAARAHDEARFARTMQFVALDAAEGTRQTRDVLDDLIYMLAMERAASSDPSTQPEDIH